MNVHIYAWVSALTAIGIGAVPTSGPAASLGLLAGDIGVEYKTSDFVLCARVHSVKQAPVIGALGVRSPLPAFDHSCLFIVNELSRTVF